VIFLDSCHIARSFGIGRAIYYKQLSSELCSEEQQGTKWRVLYVCDTCIGQCLTVSTCALL